MEQCIIGKMMDLGCELKHVRLDDRHHDPTERSRSCGNAFEAVTMSIVTHAFFLSFHVILACCCLPIAEANLARSGSVLIL